MNNLSCIGINLDQLIKEFLWFEDAFANDYQKIIVLLKDYCSTKSHGEMETTAYWHTYPTDW